MTPPFYRPLWAHSLATALLLAMTTLAHAAPMGFKESTMVMADFSPKWRELSANYAVTPRDAFGAGLLAMRSDDQHGPHAKRRNATLANYTRLAQRWNMPSAQANMWLFAGLGTVSGNDFAGQRTFWSPGVQVDYETTRLYVASTLRLYRASEMNHDTLSLRAGFSFYETDYDEPQPWLIVEAKRSRGLTEKTEITPMLRVIHKRYFVEAGVSNAGTGRVNLMLNF